ncbi:hypothetical protein PHLCEN_2v12515 [Hermanssonia centrifuga]|uniref:Uncharacterized protein n=1 Tax=Hermanssonia centrifuga TaxID=98765 RepID=A0A2R6NI65_9APHY|nr:hypothetical protein PHLCEN_2v12515 [Hermanssonia centrifuga]
MERGEHGVEVGLRRVEAVACWAAIAELSKLRPKTRHFWPITKRPQSAPQEAQLRPLSPYNVNLAALLLLAVPDMRLTLFFLAHIE